MLKTGMLKNDYLSMVLFDFNNIGTIIKSLIPWITPFILTWIMVWKMPKWILIPALIQEENYRLRKRLIRIQNDATVKLEEKELLKQTVENLDIVSQKKTKEQEIQRIDPKQEWRIEFLKFKKMTIYPKFKYILDSSYNQNGKIKIQDSYSGITKFEIPKDILAYCHSSGLVDLLDSNTEIQLTEKGKFFVKEYYSDMEDPLT